MFLLIYIIVMNLSTPAIPALPPRLRMWVDGLQSSGRYSFSKEEASRATRLEDPILKVYLYRLVQKGRLAMPRRGFFVIVPLEYGALGAPPPPWFIDPLMKYEGRGYYVGLLSAAAVHGAGHQQPQEFQVMVDAQRKPAKAGRHRLAFFVKAGAGSMPHLAIKTPTGTMQVSTRAMTALDLVTYHRHAGGMDHAATVIAELAEEMTADDLVLAAGKYDAASLQRLGFLLEWTQWEDLAAKVEDILRERDLIKVRLRPDLPSGSATLSKRWSLWANDFLEKQV